MRMPDFIVIGAAKSGTTSLFRHLDGRDDVFLPAIKEPEYFARDDRFAAGPTAYAALFAQARPDQTVGEASTLYTLGPHFPQAAARIAAALPDVRLVYMMREPVARAYSFYGQLVKGYQNRTRDMQVRRTFEECLDPDAPRGGFLAPHQTYLPDVPGLFTDGSDYLMQIGAYLEHFPREALLFVTFEEYMADPAAVMTRICAHVGIAPPVPGTEAAPRVNVAADHFGRVRIERFAAGLTASVPLAGAVSRRLPPGLRRKLRDGAFAIRERAAALAAGRRADRADRADPAVPLPMRPATRAALKARFDPDRPALAALTGLDLDRWWGPVQGR
jgi:hypothetical protein